MPFRRRPVNVAILLLGFALMLALVIGIGTLSLYQLRATALVGHTLEVQNDTRTALSYMQDAETGQRGYLLTGRSEFLEPYNSAHAALDDTLRALRAAVQDNPAQVARVDRLKSVMDSRQELLRVSVALKAQANRDAINFERLQRGKVMMDQARAIIAEIERSEGALLQQRRDAADNANRSLSGLLINTGLALLVLGYFAVRDARKRLAAAAAQAEKLSIANARLQAESANREQAEAQVRQMQKTEAIGQLTGGIAHDFNNMLAIVIGSLDMAKRRLGKDPKRAEECIDNALEGAQRAAQLTGRLLAFSRQQPLAPTVLDLNKLVGGMSELLRRTLGDTLRVETVLAGGLWRTRADPVQVENALLNLCVNARDAMPDGGRLTIETLNSHLDERYAAQHAEVAAGQYVVVSVTDTGTGMSPEIVERAFDPFYTTKGPSKGTGLGLSQVFGFVKQSGGHVKIYSEPGVGTTVKLYLPRYTGDEQVSEAPMPGGVELPRAKSGEIILAVEDDDRVRQLSVDALRELGYFVIHASDAAQAIATLPLHPKIDLLFTDIVMPDMNGRLLADKVHELRPEIAVLYTTGYTRNAIVHNGVLDTGVHFLAKPFTIEQLAAKVREAIDSTPA